MTDTSMLNQYVDLENCVPVITEAARLELVTVSQSMRDILSHRHYSADVYTLVDKLQSSYRTLCDKRNKWYKFRLEFMFSLTVVSLDQFTETHHHNPYALNDTEDPKESDEELFGCFRTGLVALINSNQSNLKESFEFLQKYNHKTMCRWACKYAPIYANDVPIFVLTSKDLRIFGFDTKRYDRPLAAAIC